MGNRKTYIPIFISNAVFIISYVFYAVFFRATGTGIVYPVYLAPVFVYLFLAAAAYGYSAITGERFSSFFVKAQLCLLSFSLLFLAPLAVKVNIPDPHNFTLRKLELTLAASYITYIIALAAYFLYRVNKAIDIGAIHPKRIFRYLLVFFAVFYFAVSLWMNYANEPTGDEPAYLLVAHSILHDRDLDLKNNFENKDYKNFYKRRELAPQKDNILYKGKMFSYHSVLFSLIIAPFYMLAGRLGVTIMLNIISALFIVLIFRLMHQFRINIKSSIWVSVITGMSLPFIIYINAVSTEVISGVFLLGAYLWLKENKNIWIFSVLAAAALWLHLRNIPVYAAVCLLFIITNRKKIPEILKFVSVQAAAIGIRFLLNYIMFGMAVPAYNSGEGTLLDRFTFDIIHGTLTLFLDRQLGLFIYSPVYVLAGAGAVLLFKKEKKDFFEVMLIFLPYFLMIASWDDNGSGNPTPRYFVPVLFIFSLLSGIVISKIKENAGKLVTGLAGYSMMMGTVILYLPWFKWDKAGSESWIFYVISSVTGINFTGILPSFRIENQGYPVSTAILIIAVILVNFYVFFSIKNRGNT